MRNSGSPIIRKNATYSQSSVIHPLIIIAVITIVYCTCSFWFTFCIPEQEGILYAHVSIWSVEVRQRHFLWIVYVDSLPAFAGCFLELNDVYWYLHSTSMFFKVLSYFSTESEFIVASLLPLRGQSFLS